MDGEAAHLLLQIDCLGLTGGLVELHALTAQVKEVLDISESTLYPVLRRLQRDGLLKVYDRPYQGRNRRYYAITPVGRTQLSRRREEWVRFRDGVEELLKEDEQDGQTYLFG